MEAEAYNSSVTRNQFFFYEVRTVAGLMCDGMGDAQIMDLVKRENLFQFPTERSLERICRDCIARIRCVGDRELTETIAHASFEPAKQAALYAYLSYSRLLYEFWLRIGEKYEAGDDSFSKADIRNFFSDLETHSPQVRGWSEETKKKILSVILHTMTETGYLDTPSSNRLNAIWLYDEVRAVMERRGEDRLFSAFQARR